MPKQTATAMADDPLLSSQQVARRLGMSVDWVRRQFGKRAGVVRFGGKNMKIPESMLAKFIAERGGANGTTHAGKKRA